MSTTSNETLVGRLLDGRYLVGERIARGGMASVHLATDTRLDRTVAVKIMHPGMGDDEEFTARFEREARSAARLNHPNVVAVFDQGEDQDCVYLVMEYVPGQTLRDVVRAEAPMPPRRALTILEPLLVALSAAHDARLIHRDIKPENVLITPDGQIKVADFGLARAVTGNTSTATTGVLIGTVSYLAPELVVNRGADARSDVYAVGALLYEMLTGDKPHVGESPIQVAYKHVHEDVPAPSLAVPGIPPYIDALVARATSRDPDQRSADARVLLHQVRRARNALDQGLEDDVELTVDLRPHLSHVLPPDSVDLVPSGEGSPEVTSSLQGYEATTAVARYEEVTPARPGGPVPPMHREAYVQAAAPSPRRRRGQVILVTVIVLALLAGILGWYFGVGRYESAPDLTGMTVGQARQQATDQDYTLTVTGTRFDETVPKGSIIETDPGAGGRILPEGTIDAWVSKGKERYVVPDLRGKSEDEAAAILTDRNLQVGDVRRRYSENVEADQVIKTVLDTGAKVKRNTPVDLVVSKGRKPITVVDFTGKSADRAVDKLTAAGLAPTTSTAHDDDVDKGDVISQDPVDGTLFKGDGVKLVVSDGPEPIDVPGVIGKTEDDARKQLEDAGFEVKVEKDGAYVGLDRVLRQDPGVTATAQPGSTITLYLV